jgi:succinate dehydrogenase (ubiquinone) membrane anchor subunit
VSLFLVSRSGASTEQLFHWSSYGLASLAPVALILSPSFLNFPVDFALGLIIPVHMHIGLVGVVEDYVPRPSQSLARFILAVLSVLAGIGLLKINLCGAGITESVKSVWREPKDKEQKRIKQ